MNLTGLVFGSVAGALFVIGFLFGLHRGRMQGVDRAEAITKDDIANLQKQLTQQERGLRDILRRVRSHD